jgi:hypothetical protein
VKRYFEIKEYTSFKKTMFYTIHEIGEDHCETDKFFLRFMNEKKYQEDVQTIKYWIEKIGREFGALERYFRPERKANALPIPPPKSNLRLYCLRVSDEIVILGNGGIKSSKLVQNSPDALPHFELMNLVAFILKMKNENDQIYFQGKGIEGDLSFYINQKNPI